MKTIAKRYWKLLTVIFIIGMITIPIADMHIIERDRNRNEIYGELFWQIGFNVYRINDHILKTQYNVSDDHLLASYLNITYEYPVITLLFFAFITGIFPGIHGLQHIFINMVLLLIYVMNLLLILYVGRKYLDKSWFKIVFSAYAIYGFIMAVFGGKVEPLTDLFFLISIYFMQQNRTKLGQFMLGISVQTKVYTAIAFPIYFIIAPIDSIFFFLSLLITVIPFLSTGLSYDTLIRHFLNDTGYSPYATNSLWLGRVFMNPWSITTFLIFIILEIFTIFKFDKDETARFGFKVGFRIRSIQDIYLVLFPGTLFLYRWVMPWYFGWFIPLTLILKKEQSVYYYLRVITIIGFLYVLGILINIDYYLSNGLLQEFVGHFQP